MVIKNTSKEVNSKKNREFVYLLYKKIPSGTKEHIPGYRFVSLYHERETDDKFLKYIMEREMEAIGTIHISINRIGFYDAPEKKCFGVCMSPYNCGPTDPLDSQNVQHLPGRFDPLKAKELYDKIKSVEDFFRIQSELEEKIEGGK